MKDRSAQSQLDDFLDKYEPEVAGQARGALAKMRELLPGAIELVYDNYNALAIGFGATDRTSDAIFSIAVYPRWVSLFFLQGAGLPDPQGVLQGNGNVVRHVVLKTFDVLDRPAIRTLMATALKRSKTPIDGSKPGRLLIKSISAHQRPRRPASKSTKSGSGPRATGTGKKRPRENPTLDVIDRRASDFPVPTSGGS